jgi:GAF domain-containing protein
MFGRVLGLDGRESYRELRRERLCCPHRPAEKLLHMSERIHGEKTASELQDRVTELVEQQAAISEVLLAIARSPDDLQPIFDAILDSATRLCRADAGTLRLSEESGLRLVAVRGDPLWVSRALFPALAEKGSLLSRVATSRLPTHIPDLTALEGDRHPNDFSTGPVNAGFRTGLFVPLLKDDEIVGIIALGRKQLQPFTDKHISLCRDLAAQAAIALESTRRERQYREMQSELAHANRVATIGQLTASIVHEIKQPFATARTNAAAALRFLDNSQPDVAEVREALTCVVNDADRASDVGRSDRVSHQKSATPEGGHRPQCGDPGGDRPNPRRSGQDRRHGGHATRGRVTTHPMRSGATATGDVELDCQRHPIDERR